MSLTVFATQVIDPLKSSSQLLPTPFAWITIPPGIVTLEDGGGIPKGGQTFDVPAFKIAKYPVTNAQYRLFLGAGGYDERQWWTDAGWDARLKGWAWDGQQKQWAATGSPWQEPRCWHDNRWNGDDYPVVGVSWYEAAAFCRWVSATVGESIMLPTARQWQRAAQGDDGRKYPWGSAWDSTRCNNDSSGTTPVTQYEGSGDSPWGVVDMAGNTWDWCADDSAADHDGGDAVEQRELRGGSWDNYYPDRFRCAFRFWSAPYQWNYNRGFRFVCSA